MLYMARYIGPKNKLSRREGFDLFNKGEKLNKFNVLPGQAGKNKPKKQTEYGKQLRSKQRAKRFYGVMERQFRNYVVKANKSKSNISNALVSLLERRLDNVVFRLGLVPTRPAGRQVVNHQHVLVNDKIQSTPSFEVKVGDVITLDKKAAEIPYIKELLSEDKKNIPEWLERNENGGKVVREPVLTDVKEPITIVDIFEFYSR